MDLFGPVSVKSLGKKSYGLVVTDDSSRFSWVNFLSSKDETPEVLIKHLKRCETISGCKVKLLRSDNGIEFKNRNLTSFCEDSGIVH
jgi:transposase InsO family protein